MTERSYKIDELARAAGMSVRTVRYYVQRGLLAAPAFRGKDTAYGHEHLVRLRAIRRLQEAYLPLDAIHAELAGLSLAELQRVAEGTFIPPPVTAPDPRDGPDEAARDDVLREAQQVFRRITLFPGVDLTVADDAPAQSVRLVKEMLEILEAMAKKNDGGRRR